MPNRPSPAHEGHRRRGSSEAPLPATHSARRFILAGNGSHRNRGCEAIERGTTAILRRQFGPDIEFAIASFTPNDGPEAEPWSTRNAGFSHISLGFKRFSGTWLLWQAEQRLRIRLRDRYWMLRDAARTACASLQLGGDNYSLDYGVPEQFLALDRYLLVRNVPTFLWGATVGPFDANLAFAAKAHLHLNTLNGIFVRESCSLEYLARNGVTAPVRLVADPAFAMSPEKPHEVPVADLNQGPVGINFSPLMARYLAGGSLEAWMETCKNTIIAIMREAGENILLIPHVFQPGNNDEDFLTCVAGRVARETGTHLSVTSHRLSASQIKWIISRCSIFVGARTHATIAALSTGVPTLSLAYSMKARGINRDLFGSLDYCVELSRINADYVAARTLQLMADASRIRDHLAACIPAVEAKAYAAGEYLAEALREPQSHCPVHSASHAAAIAAEVRT